MLGFISQFGGGLATLGSKNAHKIMQTRQTTKTCRKGTAMWIGVSMDVAIGTAVGVAINDVAQGVAIGIALGAAVGAAVTFAQPKKV
jgi:ABC-type Fe3+-siderophore transport system permease subunit